MQHKLVLAIAGIAINSDSFRCKLLIYIERKQGKLRKISSQIIA